MDGIGGSAKALVRAKVKSKACNSTLVQNSIDFYHIVKILMPNVTVLHVSNDEIVQLLNEKQPWKNVNIVNGIRKIHSITCKDGIHVKLWSHAKSVEPVFEKDLMCIELVKSSMQS